MTKNKTADRYLAAGITAFIFSISLIPSTSYSLSQQENFWNAGASKSTQEKHEPVASLKAGSIAHVVDHVEALTTIPAERAREDRRKYARPLEAKPGNIWLILQGTSTNTGRDTRKLTVNAFDLIDSGGNEYRPSYSTGSFLPDALKLSNSELAPGSVKPWMLFFEVPENADGVKLRTSNMHRMDEQFSAMPVIGITEAAYQNIGDVHHRVTGVDEFTEIPAEWTIEKYKNRPRAQPAKEGNKWMVLSGYTENRGSDGRKLSSNDLTLIDENGNEYRSKSVFRYQEDSDKLKRSVLKAGETRNWKLFFEVPFDAPNPRMRVSNLRWVEEQKATLALPEPMRLLENALEALTQNQTLLLAQ